MGMRFRKSISLGKGARINISKSGFGASVGTKGARYTVHSSGRRTSSVGIPGSGLSYVSSKGGGGKKRSSSVSSSGGLTVSQQARLYERYEKKEQLINGRRSRPISKLKELYASGKVDKATFEKLQARDAEVTKDLIVFGRGSGVKLAERYVTGKMTKEEFENMKDELLGGSEAEKDSLSEGYKLVASRVNEFVVKARQGSPQDHCSYCDKPKKFYSPLRAESDFKLCGKCIKEYNRVRKYEGFKGNYYTVDPILIDPDIKNLLSVNILPEHLLSYR